MRERLCTATDSDRDPVALLAGLHHGRAQQRAADPLAPMQRRHRDRHLGRLLVDEPVAGLLGSLNSRYHTAPIGHAFDLGDHPAVARAAPALVVAAQDGFVEDLLDRLTRPVRVPAGGFVQHRLEEVVVVLGRRSDVHRWSFLRGVRSFRAHAKPSAANDPPRAGHSPRPRSRARSRWRASSWAGSPRAVQTRIVRGVQLGVEVHVKSGDDDVTHAWRRPDVRGVPVPGAAHHAGPSGDRRDRDADRRLRTRTGTRELVDAIPGLRAVDREASEQALARNAASLGLVGIGRRAVDRLGALEPGAARPRGDLRLPPRAMVEPDAGARGHDRARARAVRVPRGRPASSSACTSRACSRRPAARSCYLVGCSSSSIAYFTLAYWLLTPERELRVPRAPGRRRRDGRGVGGPEVRRAFLVDRSISQASALYGTLGTVFGLLLFIRLAMWLFLYGAEVNSLVRSHPPRRRDGRRQLRLGRSHRR